ncbi:MAG: hypothetical protein ACR2RL_00305, partial [Gammaproteobacteria bacterium]
HASSAFTRHQRKIINHHKAIMSAVKRSNNQILIEVLTEHGKLFQSRLINAIGATRAADFPVKPDH